MEERVRRRSGKTRGGPPRLTGAASGAGVARRSPSRFLFVHLSHCSPALLPPAAATGVTGGSLPNIRGQPIIMADRLNARRATHGPIAAGISSLQAEAASPDGSGI